MPKLLGRLHPRFQTPYMAFIVMGAIATALLVGNAALSDRADNVFWMIFKLSGVCFLVSYLMVFPAFVILRRRRADQPRPYRMPGGALLAWPAATFCWLFIAGATLLFFKPAPTAENPAGAVRESWLLVGETVATLAVGLLLMPKGARAWKATGRDTPPVRPSR
jgi:amino acid transporter